MSIFGPQPGNWIDEHGVHRDALGRRRTMLDIAADSFVPSAGAEADIARLLDRWKPREMLTAAELDARIASDLHSARLVERRRHLHESGIVRVLPDPGRNVPAIVSGELKPREALEVVRTWWADGEPARPWLMMGGSTGLGKTWAGAWVLADAGGRYATTADLIRAFGSLRDARGPVQIAAAEQTWERIIRAPVLVLDEFGREDWPATRPAFHELVERRGSRRTLVISNIASASIRRAFETGDLDRRTASRLAPLLLQDRFGRGCWDVTGPDMRAA